MDSGGDFYHHAPPRLKADPRPQEPTMKFFIDTADVNEIRKAHAMGCVDGVTTNPSLLAKVGRPLEETIKEICSIVDGPISAECVSLEAPDLIKEGRTLAKIHPNVVV